MSGAEKQVGKPLEWNERFLDLAKRLLGHRPSLEPKLSHVGSDPDYLSTVAVEFEELTDVLLANSASFVGESGSWQSALADASVVRVAAAVQLDAILVALETPWGLDDALYPLRLLRSALQDVIHGRKNPLLERKSEKQKGSGGRPAHLAKEHDRSWRYISALVIDARVALSNRPNSLQAAREWVGSLYDCGFDTGEDGPNHARRFDDWYSEARGDPDYRTIHGSLIQLDGWPKDETAAHAFSQRAAAHLVALDRVWGPHRMPKKAENL